MTTDGGLAAAESPDGKTLYFCKDDPGGIWRMPRDGGPEVQVLPHGRINGWALNDQGICYVNEDASPLAIECYDFVSRRVSVIATRGVPRTERGFTLSPDGRSILYARASYESDIMLVDNFSR